MVDPSTRTESALRVAQRLPQLSVTLVSSPSQTEHGRSGRDDMSTSSSAGMDGEYESSSSTSSSSSSSLSDCTGRSSGGSSSSSLSGCTSRNGIVAACVPRAMAAWPVVRPKPCVGCVLAVTAASSWILSSLSRASGSMMASSWIILEPPAKSAIAASSSPSSSSDCSPAASFALPLLYGGGTIVPPLLLSLGQSALRWPRPLQWRQSPMSSCQYFLPSPSILGRLASCSAVRVLGSKGGSVVFFASPFA